MDEFDRFTIIKEYQHYILLLDGHIIFHEALNATCDEIIGHLQDVLWNQLDHIIFQISFDSDLALTICCKNGLISQLCSIIS